MVFRILADVTFLVHLLFVLFVIFGGLLVWIRFGIAWMHLPALIWGVLIEWYGWVCPLTPLENWLYSLANVSGYSDGFIEHYLTSIIYPAHFTHGLRISLGATLLVANIVLYACILRSRLSKANERSLPTDQV